MTRNQHGLRKVASTADLYSDPSPPPRQANLSRAFTTVQRPRLNPFIHSQIAQQAPSVRHSIAAPFDNLIDFDDDFGQPHRQQRSPTPPPVPPKVKIAPAPEIPTFAPRKEERPPREVKRDGPEKYTKPFCDFLTENPTVFHTVDAVGKDLEKNGYKKLSERDSWDLKRGGKYYVERNGSSLVAFAIGEGYEAGNGASIMAGHIDALTAKLKPIPKLRTKAGYVQLGVAPYAGALNNTWWDRDLGVGGRVLIREGGKIVTKLVKLDWPIARIPTLAPHFGAAAQGPFNKETQMVPIIGLDNSDMSGSEGENWKPSLLGGEGAFTATQPPRLVRAISKELNVTDYSSIVNWELELFDYQPATIGGLEKEFIFAGRIDDKLCSWAAIQALINSTSTFSRTHSASSQIKIVALFDDEEIGSLLRQGARGNFLPTIVERIVDSFASKSVSSLINRTYANSFLVSSDVCHAVNPNFLGSYLENHAPRLNIGPAVTFDSSGHMTTDSVSAAILTRCTESTGSKLQVFQIRNDSRGGGTVGPMLSAHMGVRSIDCGIPQLSMHSIRATTGSLDPGLGVIAFQGFLENFETVDAEFKP
ncbi:uncharacterized protein BDR25DRAFT_274046 [Lindgomyces ingoldianus]|uniref:Uncharacterized protein n=1 Tax=Lindgomyces ingoldianus TaxID=673940 RepID=A0ACB6Q7D2_9PLEO|nr:uncharacterized protein BDR25DRAFT_274046 [Lindgomyces ingoldianus]KAF2462731.1 hypothetical protein BDR25DRAFT_274046 [Lindgomyces ingoldianus]